MVDRPDPPEHLDAVHRRHPHVEEHRVRALPGERCQPRLPRVGSRRHVSLLPEGPREHVRDLDIVFDQEEVHPDLSSAPSPELSHGTSSDRPRRPHVPRPPEIIVSLDRLPGHDNGRPLGDAVSTIHGERYLAEYATLLDGSPAMRSILRGESGVGKDLVARAIHAASRRCSCPFIKVNCAAIPAGLLESELFGHEKGAFTGAHRRKPGQFEYAHKGTIYLDEIAELPSALQAKLLQYAWRGNVRELENMIRRLVVLHDAEEVFDHLVTRRQQIGWSPSSATSPSADSLRDIARRGAQEAERKALAEVLERVQWNRAEAARILKVSYKTLLNKISECQLKPPRPPHASPSSRVASLTCRCHDRRSVGRVHSPRAQQRAQLAQPGALDLTDALARETELAPDRLERLGLAAGEPEATAEHLAFVLGEVVEDGHELGPLAKE